MSNMKKHLELFPPSYMQKGKNRELLVSPNHTCSYCHGNGWFWGEDGFGERIKNDCPVCGGSGSLDAVVTVEWKAAKKGGAL